MDFIRSAIDKARTERMQRGPQPASAPGVPVSAPAAGQGAPIREDAAEEAEVRRARLWADLPALGLNPRRLRRNRVYAGASDGELAAFDMMRTKLLHQMRSNKWRRVAITSPTQACGKTTLSLNLALSLARQPDLRTMLLDFDMRRPSIAEVLELATPQQFARVLTGEASAPEQLLRIGDNLAVGANRTPVPKSAELLQKVGTGQIVDAVEQDYGPDVMIFDMPPMLSTDDTLAFIDQIDCVMLVAAAGSSNMAEISRCAEELAARCNFLGVILNKCRYLASDDAYGYGYGYGYGQGGYGSGA